jgi:hypothetical protein
MGFCGICEERYEKIFGYDSFPDIEVLKNGNYKYITPNIDYLYEDLNKELIEFLSVELILHTGG